MIDVHIEHDWRTRMVKVWLYDRSPLGIQVFSFNQDGNMIGKFHPNDQAFLMDEPTMLMDPEWLQRLVEKAKDLTPPSQATQEHLKDAIAVRDRLLALVEKR